MVATLSPAPMPFTCHSQNHVSDEVEKQQTQLPYCGVTYPTLCPLTRHQTR